ncbi:MAG: hypothetical protein ACTHN0_13865 [Aquihabitans sp.]
MTLAILTVLYAFALLLLGFAMGILGGLVAFVVCVFEARTVVYEVDERVEIRGDALVAHHHGRIEVFRRADIAEVVRDDYAGVPSYGHGGPNIGGLGSVAAMLRIHTVEGREVEIWRCASNDRQFAALDAAVDIIEIWRLREPLEREAGRGEPPSPSYRAPD